MGILTSVAAMLTSTESVEVEICIRLLEWLESCGDVNSVGFGHRSSVSPSVVLLSAIDCSFRWFFRCFGVIRNHLLSTTCKYWYCCFSWYFPLQFLLLLIHQLFYFVDKSWQFTSFIIMLSLEHGIDTFTHICGERLWRAAQLIHIPP